MYQLTHREFFILCEENVEVTHDRREEEAMYAIMYSVASRGKGKKGKLPKVSELYDRTHIGEPKKAEDVWEQQQEAMSWLKNFNIVDKTEKGTEE